VGGKAGGYRQSLIKKAGGLRGPKSAPPAVRLPCHHARGQAAAEINCRARRFDPVAARHAHSPAHANERMRYIHLRSWRANCPAARAAQLRLPVGCGDVGVASFYARCGVSVNRSKTGPWGPFAERMIDVLKRPRYSHR